jgi:hypothetical protein
MRKSRFGEEQIIGVLREQQMGLPLAAPKLAAAERVLKIVFLQKSVGQTEFELHFLVPN